MRSNNFSDLSQYYIDRALPMAIARVRGGTNTSPPEAVHALVDALTHEDNRGNLYDDSTFLASLLQAAGHLVPHNQKVRLFEHAGPGMLQSKGGRRTSLSTVPYYQQPLWRKTIYNSLSRSHATVAADLVSCNALVLKSPAQCDQTAHRDSAGKICTKLLHAVATCNKPQVCNLPERFVIPQQDQ